MGRRRREDTSSTHIGLRKIYDGDTQGDCGVFVIQGCHRSTSVSVGDRMRIREDKTAGVSLSEVGKI